MDENLQERHFNIIDPKGVNTIIYKVNKTEKEYLKDSPKYTIERLDYEEQFVGENKKKMFFVGDTTLEENPLVILSFGNDKVVVNTGVIEKDKVKISKQPIPMKFKTLYSEKETEFRDFTYTPNLKRPITIIDPETTEEIKPILYLDESTNEVKGKCKLKPYKSYFAFEVKDEKDN